MAREPVAGRVKSRLAGEVGVTEATRFYRACCRSVIARLAREPHWRTWLALSPAAACASRMFPREIARRPQVRGDLAARMQAIMDWPVRGPIIIIGTDIPAVRPSYLSAAFRALGRHDAVFGPAEDGGYWLVGLRRRCRVPHAFEAVRWSSAHALSDTLANLSGLAIARIATLSDVDRLQDLERVGSWSGRRIVPADIGCATDGPAANFEGIKADK
ncbi:MAG: TIGR04282 family arsenosugar biosynthesis glycosyltransferase [Hyphomicrobiaceae bacterium]